MPHIGQPAQGDAEERIENRECRAIQKADLGVVHAESRLDVLGQYREDLPVDEIENVNQKQNAENVPGVDAPDRRAAGFR